MTKHFITAANIGVHATPQTAIAASGWPNGGGSVVLVGHQPYLGELAALLMTGRADPWSIKKGAVWWFSRREDDPQTALRLVISTDLL